MSKQLKILFIVLSVPAAMAIHIGIAWQVSLVTPLALAMIIGRRGWLWGGITYMASWLLLLVYGMLAHHNATFRFLDTASRFITGGNDSIEYILPSVSLLLAWIMGALAGIGGMQLRVMLLAKKGEPLPEKPTIDDASAMLPQE